MHLRVVSDSRQAQLERSEGRARLAFKRHQNRTVLSDLYQSGSAKIRFPGAHSAQTQEAVVINTSGGLTDGDRFDVAATWGDGTTASVTTQAAERIYRSRGGYAAIETEFTVAADATGLWLPQETILFDGGHVRRALNATIHETGRLIALEALVFGRTAMGEVVGSGSIFDRWRVRFGERLVFADGFRLDGDIAAKLVRPAILNGGCAVATMILVGRDAAALVEPLRCCAKEYGSNTGVSRIGPVVVVRIVAVSGAELRSALSGLAETALAQLDPGLRLPRVWHL